MILNGLLLVLFSKRIVQNEDAETDESERENKVDGRNVALLVEKEHREYNSENGCGEAEDRNA